MKVKSPQILHGYQRRAIRHIMAYRESMLWVDMGLGKTVCTLSAIAHLLDTFEIRGALVVAPLRVCQTVWKQEAAGWEHTRHLDVRIVHGKPMMRERALMIPADVHVINYENLLWLLDMLQVKFLSRGKPLPFDMIVFDECTMVKSTRIRQGSARMGPILKDLLLPEGPGMITRTVGLTGTPLPNGYQDIFGQFLVVDKGKRLGQSYTNFTSRFFTQPGGFKRPQVTAHGKEVIHQLIGDITLELSEKDYLDLPEETINEVTVSMPAKVMAAYERMERKFFHQFDSGQVVEIDSKAVLSNKCLQFANGAMYYGEERTDWDYIHDAKLDALEGILDGAGGPVLLAYQFRHDAARIKKRFGDRITWVDASVGHSQMVDIQARWNRQEIPVISGPLQSISRGLNLQHGGHTVVWFGLCWSWELYIQFNKRVMRQGQKHPVVIHHLLTEGTLDYAVLTALRSKQSDESSLRDAVKLYRQQKYGETAA